MIRQQIIKLYYRIFRQKIYNSYKVQKKIRMSSISEIKRVQMTNLKTILNHAYNNSDFYRMYFDENDFSPNNFTNLDEFDSLPVIDKIHLKNNFEDVTVNNLNNFVEDFTSGSTGQPFKFLKDVKNEIPSEHASFIILKENIGIKPFMRYKTLVIKTYPKNRVDLEKYDFKKIISSNSIGIAVSDLNYKNIDKIHHIIKFNKIEIVYGYSQSLYYLFDLLSQTKSLSNIKFAIGIGEEMPDNHRRKLESKWNLKVGIDYGSSECMRLGFQCKSKKLHLDMFRFHVRNPEFSSDSQKVIVTNFNNFIFPFINYDIGDEIIISKSRCDCGCNFPIIERIMGRNTDAILSTNSQKYSSTFFTIILEHFHSEVNRFQLVQKDFKNILVKIEITEKFNKNTFKELYEKLNSMTNNEFNYEIIKVERIKPSKNGKYRIVTPLVNK